MQFTTVEECQEKINNMRSLLENFKKQNEIQFPIEDNEEKQFQHYSIGHIYYTLNILDYNINSLQEELDRYKKAINYKEENNSLSEDEDYIKYANNNAF